MRTAISFAAVIALMAIAPMGGFSQSAEEPGETSPPVADSAAQTTVIPVVGDVSGDGSVTSYDISLLTQNLLGRYALSGDSLPHADANGDGAINVCDIVLQMNGRSDSTLTNNVFYIDESNRFPTRGVACDLLLTATPENRLIFQRLNDGPLPLVVGDIVYGGFEGGFARRVVSAKEASPVVTATTVDVGLQEIFSTHQMSKEIDLAGSGIRLDLTGMELLNTDTAVVASSEGTVTVTAGAVTFEPKVNLDFSIEESELHTLRVSTLGMIEVELHVSAETDARGHWRSNLIVPNSQVIVPFQQDTLWGQVSMELLATVEMASTASHEATTAVKLELPFEITRELIDDDTSNRHVGFTTITEDLSAEITSNNGTIGVQVTLTPIIRVTLMGHPLSHTRMDLATLLRAGNTDFLGLIYAFDAGLSQQVVFDMTVFDLSHDNIFYPREFIWGPLHLLSHGVQSDPDLRSDQDPLTIYETAIDPPEYTLEFLRMRVVGERNPLMTPMLFDNSGSLRGTDPKKLRVEAGQAFVNQLDRETDIVAIEIFKGTSQEFGYQFIDILQGFTSDQELLHAALAQLDASGYTPLYEALLDCLDHFEMFRTLLEFEGDTPMILFSDGMPNGVDVESQATALAQELQIPIIALGLGPAAEQSPMETPQAVEAMRRLARNTNGAYIPVLEDTDLVAAYDHIISPLTVGHIDLVLKIHPTPPPGTVIKLVLYTNYGEIRITFTAPSLNSTGELEWSHGVVDFPTEEMALAAADFSLLNENGDLVLLDVHTDNHFNEHGEIELRTVPIKRFYPDNGMWNPLVPEHEETRIEPTMIEVPSSTFAMGDSLGEGEPDELPIHGTSLSVYEISQHEVTTLEYIQFLNQAYEDGDIVVNGGIVYLASNPNQPLFFTRQVFNLCQVEHYEVGGFVIPARTGLNDEGDLVARPMEDHPVVAVTWYGAAAYCNWLSRQNGLQEVYRQEGSWRGDLTKNGYHLPTEAQWERAAAWNMHNSTHSRYALGAHEIDQTLANVAIDGFANPLRLVEYPYTTPIGHYVDSMTTEGCFDMTGNAREWCHDWYSATEYQESDNINPSGPDQTDTKVVRGGSWFDSPEMCRTANRMSERPTSAQINTGFRVARQR